MMRTPAHRKDGTWAKKPGPDAKPKPACTMGDCLEPVLARDLCRKHYDRWRKWGDPAVIGKAGGPRFVPAELSGEGITARQRNHWASRGVLGVAQDPSTGRYLWTENSVRVALAVKRLMDAGLTLELAGAVAREAVNSGANEITVGDGVVIRLDLPAADPVWT